MACQRPVLAYLWTNEHPEFVVRTVSANQEGVRSYLLQQVEAGSHDLVDPAVGLLWTIWGKAIRRGSSPRGRHPPAL